MKDPELNASGPFQKGSPRNFFFNVQIFLYCRSYTHVSFVGGLSVR